MYAVHRFSATSAPFHLKYIVLSKVTLRSMLGGSVRRPEGSELHRPLLLTVNTFSLNNMSYTHSSIASR